MRPKFFFFFPLFFVASSLAVMLLWNNVIVDVLHVGRIHFLQAAGILIVCRILFGRFYFSRGHRRFYGPPHHVRARWADMTPEEREKFKGEWKRRCRRQ